jgi:hypothetical protein
VKQKFKTPDKELQRQSELSRDGKTLTVRVPIVFSSTSARKQIVVPLGAHPWQPPRPERFDNALITALARAHRWKAMIESGDYGTTADLARAEKINFSYLCRVLRLTLLSPKIVVAILDRTATNIELKDLMRPLAVEWQQQERIFGA